MFLLYIKEDGDCGTGSRSLLVIFGGDTGLWESGVAATNPSRKKVFRKWMEIKGRRERTYNVDRHMLVLDS